MDQHQHLSPVWTHLTDFLPVRGEGVYLVDADGNRLLDFTSGIGVTNTGHCHPAVVKAIQEQAAELIFGQMNIVIPPSSVALAERLAEVTPPGIETFFFSNSGAEAVEASVKLARHATHRRNIIVFQGSFHGRTSQTMAMTTSKYIYRYDYQPLPGGVFVAPYPYSYYYGWDDGQTTDFCMRELDRLFHSQTLPDETAAVIIEPVLGEGGYVPAPVGFLRQLRDFCDQQDLLLIADEVQSGFGRTGKFFAFEHAGIEPDVIVMAKGLGSGMPISGIGASRELMEKWKPGSHGGTYGGGSAVASAAALASINTLEKDRLIENAGRMGDLLIKKLQDVQQAFPVIGDVRGRGLMVAVEFAEERKGSKERVEAVQQACLDRQLLLLTCGTFENVIRWIPPLVVNEAQIAEAVHRFRTALREVFGEDRQPDEGA